MPKEERPVLSRLWIVLISDGIAEGSIPMEMVLQAVMYCTRSDVQSNLEKMKVLSDSFEVREEH